MNYNTTKNNKQSSNNNPEPRNNSSCTTSRSWLGVAISMIILLGTVLLQDDSEIVSNTNSSTKMKSILPVQRKDSEHGNQYLCEYLMSHVQKVNETSTSDSPLSQRTSPLKYVDFDCGYDYGKSRLRNFLTSVE
jgi:hypothetical protein